MIITILPIQSNGFDSNYNTLYNLIKRSQEDLQSANPLLKNFVLELKQLPFPPMSGNSTSVNHSLSEDKSKITVTAHYYIVPTTDKIQRLLSQQLVQIRESLFL